MKFIFLFFILFTTNVFAYYNHTYDVTGYDQYGGRVHGEVFNSDYDARYVYGRVTDENGNTYNFDGIWMTDHDINGRNDEGTAIDLSIY